MLLAYINCFVSRHPQHMEHDFTRSGVCLPFYWTKLRSELCMDIFRMSYIRICSHFHTIIRNFQCRLTINGMETAQRKTCFSFSRTMPNHSNSSEQKIRRFQNHQLQQFLKESWKVVALWVLRFDLDIGCKSYTSSILSIYRRTLVQ